MQRTSIRPVIVNTEMRGWIFVKVETDEVITGWDEAPLKWKACGSVGCIENLAPVTIGENRAV